MFDRQALAVVAVQDVSRASTPHDLEAIGHAGDDAALILHLCLVLPILAATILGHGLSLIHDYHRIMASYLKDPGAMRDHHTARGVKLLAQALQSNRHSLAVLIQRQHHPIPWGAHATRLSVRACSV